MDTESFKIYYEQLQKFLNKTRFGSKAQLAFLEDFYTLINDGIPANRAIEMMVHATEGINREVALYIGEKIAEGQPLAEGMRDWFNINITEIIRVGEQGGALNATVKSAINTLTQSSGAMTAFIGAIAYPLMVIIMACSIIVYLDGSVFMQFRNMKPLAQWPQAGRDLVGLANLIRHFWWLFIVGAIGAVLLMSKILNDYIGAFRSKLDSVPPFTLYKQFVAAHFMETLGLLVANGIVFKNALKVMQYRSSPYLTSHLVTMEHQLSTGKGNIADILDTGLIEEKDILRLRIMGEVKGFEHGLVRMGVRGAENTIKSLKVISKILGGVLMAVGGYLIVTIIKGIYMTAMSMGS